MIAAKNALEIRPYRAGLSSEWNFTPLFGISYRSAV